MGHFTVIEYSGKDSAEVLANITGSGKNQIEVVDVSEHHPIGFRQENDQEDNE